MTDYLKVFFVIPFILLSCTPGMEEQESAEEAAIYKPWMMHHINDDYVIANSLNGSDVNKDGYLDYSVIDEWLGLQTILFHPGNADEVRNIWDRVNLGKTGNPEYSCLGDLDNDGNIDFVVVTGDDLEKGYTTGTAVFWGPDASEVKHSLAWENAGYIPSSLHQQYLYVECHDMNADGFLDILVGGRRNAMTNEYAGIKWFEAPKDIRMQRDLSQWKSHYIDRDAYSGHGFIVKDVNGDGLADLLIANADWDTPTFEEELLWYENPGTDPDKIIREWTTHTIWKSWAFYPKPQIGIGDINGDGLDDLITQTQNFINLHFQERNDSITWRTEKIKKPEEIQWIGRPIRLFDVNQDGKLDIVGMLIHNDGHLPANKYSVFWMESVDGTDFKEWDIYPIKMSDGFNTYHEWIGEKWDHCQFSDIDEDGDMDIIGNVEENYQYIEGKELPVSVYSVVWFENPLK